MGYRVQEGRVRSSKELKVGDWVKSHYRNTWKGRVLEIHPEYGSPGGCVTCQILLSRNNQPVKKTKFRLHVHYLEKIKEPVVC